MPALRALEGQMTTEPKMCYVVVMLTSDLSSGVTNRPMRADFRVHTDLVAATARQFELGKLNALPSWVMSFPDPREVAND